AWLRSIARWRMAIASFVVIIENYPKNTVSGPRVALQLSVIRAPALDQGASGVGWPPAALRWLPAGRRDGVGQQLRHTPAMVGQAGGHCWGAQMPAVPGAIRTATAADAQAVMKGTEIVDRPHQIQAVGQRGNLLGQAAATPDQPLQPGPEG